MWEGIGYRGEDCEGRYGPFKISRSAARPAKFLSPSLHSPETIIKNNNFMLILEPPCICCLAGKFLFPISQSAPVFTAIGGGLGGGSSDKLIRKSKIFFLFFNPLNYTKFLAKKYLLIKKNQFFIEPPRKRKNGSSRAAREPWLWTARSLYPFLPSSSKKPHTMMLASVGQNSGGVQNPSVHSGIAGTSVP